MNPAKPFSKSQEHFHIPILLILINFFIVTTLYYLDQYLQQTGLSNSPISVILSFGALLFLLASLYSRSDTFIKLTYLVCLALIIFIFWV